MRLSNTLVLASTNRHKLEEFRKIFSTYPNITIAPANQFVRNANKLSFAERHETYLENSVAKARLANLGLHYPTLGDDSGLEVDALGGKPGVRSHRYATPKAGVTQDQANLELLLKSLQGKSSSERTARFITVLALCIEGILVHAQSTLEGTILEAPRGLNGFGYDPVFIPLGYNKTLAEMTTEEKNAISHRAKAVHELMNQVKARGIIFAKP